MTVFRIRGKLLLGFAISKWSQDIAFAGYGVARADPAGPLIVYETMEVLKNKLWQLGFVGIRQRPIELYLFFIVVIFLKWSVLSIPYFWDELLVYSNPAKWLYDFGLHGVLPGLHDPDKFFGHTPGFSFLIAAAFKIFGETFFVARSTVLFLFLVQLFFLHKLLLPFGRFSALMGIIIYFSIPTVFSHSTQVLGDMGVASLGTVAVYFAFKRKVWPYAIFGTLTFLMKETGLAVIVPVFIVIGVEQILARRIDKKELIGFGCPLFFVVLYFVSVKLTTGNFTNFPMLHTVDLRILEVAIRFVNYFYWYIVMYAGIQFVFPVAAVAAVTYLSLDLGKMRRLAGMVVGELLCFLGGISILNFINERYFLPVYGLLCVLAVGLVANLSRKFFVRSGIYFLLLGLVCSPHLNPDFDIHSGGEANMQYVELVKLHLEALKYIEESYKEKRIYAVWPVAHQLNDPFFGYVRESVKMGSQEDYDVVVVASNSDLVGKAEQDVVIRKDELVLQKTFNRNGMYVEIWVKPQS